MKLNKKFIKLPYLFQYSYEKITTSIAFYPILMAGLSFFLIALMFYMESRGLTGWMGERIPSFLLIKSWDVAQSILNVLIGSLISLMVFSFSMVMVVLNNAASNFSPRVLPTIIADRFHQLVLGTYLASITYCILMVLNLTPSQDKIPLPGFSVLVGINLGIICLLLFVFFIHSISVSIQVGTILETLKSATLSSLERSDFSKEIEHPENFDHRNQWYTHTADRTGYLAHLNLPHILKITEEEDLIFKIVKPQSRFIREGESLFLCNKKIDEELQSTILNKFIFSSSEKATDHYANGFKQITEIALKAMSPGINDPGTALIAIDYLSLLFEKKMRLPEGNGVAIQDENKNDFSSRLWLCIVTFEELLSDSLTSLRLYCKHDVMVMQRIVSLLQFLSSRPHCSTAQRQVIQKEIDILKVDAKEELANPSDYKKLMDCFEGSTSV